MQVFQNDKTYNNNFYKKVTKKTFVMVDIYYILHDTWPGLAKYNCDQHNDKFVNSHIAIIVAIFCTEYPGVYEIVAKYLSWIRDNSNEASSTVGGRSGNLFHGRLDIF